MRTNDNEATLFRIDPSRNMQRYYSMTLQPNLFGGHSLIRTWGRIGSGGQARIDFFDDQPTAQEELVKLVQAKLRRGYCE